MAIFPIFNHGGAKRLETGAGITITNQGKTLLIEAGDEGSEIIISQTNFNTAGTTDTAQAVFEELEQRIYDLENP